MEVRILREKKGEVREKRVLRKEINVKGKRNEEYVKDLEKDFEKNVNEIVRWKI